MKTKLPKKKYWYHGTTVDKCHSIIEAGLQDKSFGLYFANRRDYAGTFARMADRYKNAKSHVVIFKIPAERIPNLELGCDHNPIFFPKDLTTAVSYDCTIPVTVDDICEELYLGYDSV